jgi:tRNA threonylcarbamoyladenosine biosynthesis protein TsaB
VLAVIDALRGEAFAEGFQRGAEREVVCELAFAGAVAPDELGRRVAQGAGGQVRGWLAVGDGAVRYRAPLTTAGATVAPDESALHLVSASAVCELGVRAAPVQRTEELLPVYRRRPDAELRPRPQEPLALVGPSEASR